MRKQLLAAMLALAPVMMADSLTGVWDAKINFNGVEIPFKIEFSGDGANVKGWFFNGDEREISTSGKFENGSLTLNFDDYATHLTVTEKDGKLTGEWGPFQKKFYPIQAERFVPLPASKAAAPTIDGLWDVEGV